jgi:hypothetical protein
MRIVVERFKKPTGRITLPKERPWMVEKLRNWFERHVFILW